MIQLVSASLVGEVDLDQNRELQARERRCCCGHLAKTTDTACRRCCLPLTAKLLFHEVKYRHRILVNGRAFVSLWRVMSQPGEALSAAILGAIRTADIWNRRDPSLSKTMFDALRTGDVTFSNFPVHESVWLQQLRVSFHQFCDARAALHTELQQVDGFQEFCGLLEEGPRAINFYYAHRNGKIWASRSLLPKEEWIQLIDFREVEIAGACLKEPNQSTDGNPAKRQITIEVRREVWRRDGGRCVTCGSQARLEFDHIIPVAMGGSNTVRNIQLLCESCNRSKGSTLG